MESDKDMDECMEETKKISKGKVTYATLLTKNILKDTCGIYPSSAIQCQRHCRFKITMFKEPTARICSNIKPEWVDDCKSRISGQKFVPLPEVTSEPQIIPEKPQIKSMSDKRFKLLVMHQKICYDALA